MSNNWSPPTHREGYLTQKQLCEKYQILSLLPQDLVDLVTWNRQRYGLPDDVTKLGNVATYGKHFLIEESKFIEWFLLRIEEMAESKREEYINSYIESHIEMQRSKLEKGQE
jgi:hypothetical protein